MTFEVEESIIVLPSAIWQELERLDALFVQETPAVVLMTCTPYGTSRKRLMVVAKLKS
jgi:sortase (surface protein transpeptidase)